MPREQKIGFTLLILAIGLGGAFLFRKPSASPAALPGLPGEDRINQQVAELRTRPFLPGIDLKTSPQADAYRSDQRLVQELAGLQSVQATGQNGKFAPPPIGVFAETPAPPRQVPIPPETRSADGALPARPTRHESSPQPRPVPQTATHLVQPGETLSGIAWKYYGSASRYLDLYEANRDQLASPNHLRPGMKLHIPANPSLKSDSENASPPAEEVKEASADIEPAVSQIPFPEQPTDRTARLDTPSAKGVMQTSHPPSLPDPAASTERHKKLFVPVRQPISHFR